MTALFTTLSLRSHFDSLALEDVGHSLGSPQRFYDGFRDSSLDAFLVAIADPHSEFSRTLLPLGHARLNCYPCGYISTNHHGIRADNDGFMYPHGYPSAMHPSAKIEMDADELAEHDTWTKRRRELTGESFD